MTSSGSKLARVMAWPLWRAGCLMISLLFVVAATSEAQPTITVKQYPLPEFNQRWRITTGPDGALWFTEGPYDTIGRITTSGVITHYWLPTKGGYPYGITSGPDGALWFTMMSAQPFLGRITVGGLITEYTLPSTESGNIWSEIIAGLGDLWTTRWCRGIDRVTTAGTANEILFQTCPTSIITGPDGAIWFTDAGTGSIGRIGVDGSRTSFPLPYDHQYSLIYPQSVTVGPDGALWFTSEHPSATGWILPKIGRLTTSGSLITYDLSSQGALGNRIITGPDGALWFTVIHDSKIGRISTDGVITMYSVPGTDVTNGFNDIVLGPDGALWIVGDGSTIVQVIVGQGDSTPPVITPHITGTLGNGWYTSAVTLSWTVTDPESGIASSSGCGTTTLAADTPGVTLTCSAINGAGLSASKAITIKIDQTPPVISGMPGPDCSIWPPDHRMIPVATVTAADAMSGIAAGSFKVTGTSNEPPSGPQISIVQSAGAYTVALLAERSSDGTGRVYTLRAVASDQAGNTTTMNATCTVPHDQRN
jgi:virginiamycin B lyase